MTRVGRSLLVLCSLVVACGDASVGDPPAPSTPDGATAPTPDAALEPCDPAGFDELLDLGELGAIASMGSPTAPATVHVHALTEALADVDPLTARYQWTFVDPDGAYPSLVGFNAAHVFASPGAGCVVLELVEADGRARRFGVTVEVGAPARTAVYVSADGDDGDDGVTEATAVRTLARAAALMAPDHAEVLLRRGDTFDVEPGGGSVFTLGGQDLRIASYGDAPARPLVRYPDATTRYFVSMRSTGRDVRVEGLAFDQPVRGGRDTQPVLVRPAGENVTVRDCEIHAAKTVVNAEYGAPGAGGPLGERALRGLLVQDNVVTSTSALTMYMVWLDGSDLVLLGNQVPNSVEEHIFRGGTPHRLLTAFNRVGNLDRRFVDAAGAACPCPGCSRTEVPPGCTCQLPGGCDNFDTAKGVHVLRGLWQYAFSDEVVDGPSGADPLCINDDPTGFPDHTVFDSLTVHGRLSVFGDHVVVRNNVVDCTGQPTCLKIATEGDYASCAALRPVDVQLLHNTLVRTDDRGASLSLDGRAADVVVAGNLGIAPAAACAGNEQLLRGPALHADWTVADNAWPAAAAASACFDQGALDVDLADWNAAGASDLAQAVTVDAAAAPSPHLAAAARRVLFDRRGVARGPTPTIGAVE
ncbi:MAG: hypothetical protein R2939_17445 [Kofleriaceae bacterium]